MSHGGRNSKVTWRETGSSIRTMDRTRVRMGRMVVAMIKRRGRGWCVYVLLMLMLLLMVLLDLLLLAGMLLLSRMRAIHSLMRVLHLLLMMLCSLLLLLGSSRCRSCT
jgi:hypothetical protein